MATAAGHEGASNGRAPAGRYRWAICALLFFVITINYIDRQVLGVLKPVIEDDLQWSEVDYGNIVSAFQFSYGVLGFLERLINSDDTFLVHGTNLSKNVFVLQSLASLVRRQGTCHWLYDAAIV